MTDFLVENICRELEQGNAMVLATIIGKRKQNAIYRALMDEGFIQDDTDRVHSPIGLAIDAETPEEIAASIVAEMIQVRASRNRG